MAIYLLKNQVEDSAIITKEEFTPEEAKNAIEFIVNQMGFRDMGSGNYYGSDKQYIAISRSGGKHVQTQELKPEVMKGLIKILQPRFYMDDVSHVHGIDELEL